MQLIQPWWGGFELAEGTAGCWTIGPAQLWIAHQAREWRIGYLLGDELNEERSEVALGLAPEQMPEQVKLSRYSFQSSTEQLSLMPLLADRPVISRPEVALFIPPAQSIQLYVSTQLWLQVRAQGALLQEQPVVRPSDTWAGPTTRAGGLSYAASTMARISLDDFPYSSWRAVTPIRITNTGTDMAAVERLHLPVPFLSLYQAANGALWTEAVELTRGDDNALDLERLGTTAPPEAGSSNLLSGPRRRADRGLLTKAFGTLFGRGGNDDGIA